jgi:hypothetical protein
MTDEQLLAFCDRTKPALATPWTEGGWRYATVVRYGLHWTMLWPARALSGNLRFSEVSAGKSDHLPLNAPHGLLVPRLRRQSD